MRIERTYVVDAEPEALWPLVANTESLNRELGLPAVTYEYIPLPDGGTKILARARSLGRSLEWVEHPFEWVSPREYVVEREFLQGPFRRYCTGTKLIPENGKTRIEGFAEIEPRGFLGRLAVKFGILRSLEKFGDAAGAFEKYLKEQTVTPYPRRAVHVRVDEKALSAAAARLESRGADGRISRSLADHLRIAPDEQVFRMRPFELADRWKTHRIATLRAFLHGTRAGLVDMTWNVVCPSCRGVKKEVTTLQDLHKSAHCDSCDIRFEADFDRSVEVRFTVNPAIRRAPFDTYCVGGPRNTPHVLVQQRLRPGERREIEVTVPPGRYALSSPQSKGPAPFEALSGGADALEACVSKEACLVRGGPVRAGTVRIAFRNGDRAERVARIEISEWSDVATSAALVTSLQEFRDLFSKEFLAPGEELSIRSLTFMFTDLRGSTSLYEQVGDASAYVLVREHFRLLTRSLRRHNGGLVKTMGDAIMATFLSPEDAVRAAIEIQQACVKESTAIGKTCIKIGLHCGPCIAVTSDERLDYFGTTVNLAQRIQSESLGGDLTFADALAQREEVVKLLREAGAHMDRFEARVKGISEPVLLFRAVFPWTDGSPGRPTSTLKQ